MTSKTNLSTHDKSHVCLTRIINSRVYKIILPGTTHASQVAIYYNMSDDMFKEYDVCRRDHELRQIKAIG